MCNELGAAGLSGGILGLRISRTDRTAELLQTLLQEELLQKFVDRKSLSDLPLISGRYRARTCDLMRVEDHVNDYFPRF